MAVSEGWEGMECFLETVDRSLFRLISFFGFVGSICDSYSWIRAFAISEQALMYRSFSGGSFSFFLDLEGGGIVIVMVAILKGDTARRRVKIQKNLKR